jgi:hypothetical protein
MIGNAEFSMEIAAIQNLMDLLGNGDTWYFLNFCHSVDSSQIKMPGNRSFPIYKNHPYSRKSQKTN